MFRRLAITALVFITITLSGCIESHLLITVNADGSGSVRETMKMNRETFAPLLEISRAFEQGERQDGDWPESRDADEFFSEKDIRSRAAVLGDAVRYVSHELIEDGSMSGYNALFEFDDISRVRIDQNPGNSIPGFPSENEGMPGADAEVLTFSMTRGNPARLIIRNPAMRDDDDVVDEYDEDDEYDDDEGFQGAAHFKDMFKGMRFSLVVQTSGDITQSNAMFRDGNRVTLVDVDFELLMENEEALRELDAAKDLSPALMKDIIMRIPGIRFDPSDEIEVVFRK